MIRKGRYKFIWSKDDPFLLYDLENDPDERDNLADQPHQNETLKAFEALVHEKWDTEKLTRLIVQSQKRRRLILDGYHFGKKPRWNHDEGPEDKVIWYRGEQGYNEWAFSFLPIQLEERR